MHVRVLLFAGLRERLRSDSATLELPAGATVRDLLAALADQHPALRELLPPCRVAVDHEFVAADHPIPASPAARARPAPQPRSPAPPP